MPLTYAALNAVQAVRQDLREADEALGAEAALPQALDIHYIVLYGIVMCCIALYYVIL